MSSLQRLREGSLHHIAKPQIIRISAHELTGVVDFDSAVRDSSHLRNCCLHSNPGDDIHPEAAERRHVGRRSQPPDLGTFTNNR